EAGEGAKRLLSASACPSGAMPVIADPDLTGVFAHEAIGHACEADLVIAGESLLAGRIGEPLGVEDLSIVDDGAVGGGFGSNPFDDEGTPASRKELVTGGVLTGYIHSLETAGKLGMRPNGGARAESGSSRPIVRMSNTLIEPGEWSFEEMVKGVKLGVLANGTRGGQVDVAKGSFQFGAQEAWLIERGEVTKPLRDAALQGTILETLKKIDAIGRDARLASPGICGKGQWVPVGDGGPHIRIQDAIVGGGA
ncbi:MAG: TldD/PmbA family protein, partial [Thermoplasmatota archaeon]